MIGPLIAYDADGNVVETLEHMTAKDAAGNVIGLVDFSAVEAAGTPIIDVFVAARRAVGAGTWPEWLGFGAHQFRVEIDPAWSRHDSARSGHRIVGLVHKRSGFRRDRVEIERAIDRRIGEANGRAADIRDLVGGPDRPLRLDETGRVKARSKTSNLPVIRASRKATNGS